MSQNNDTFTPIIPPNGIRLNLNRGLKGMFEGLIKRMPHGQKILDGGLKEVIHKAIDQNPEIPKQDLTAVQLAERMGILKPEKKVRRRKA